MNIKEIKDMITLMNENGLTELEVEKDGMRIRLRKGFGGAIERLVEVAPAAAPPQAALPPRVDEVSAKKTVEVKAPMVGTFYRAPSPDAPPFVNIGDAIEPGQVICVIEAMKLMNEIKSEVKGKIVDIPVENAEPVEYGQVLFVLEPA